MHHSEVLETFERTLMGLKFDFFIDQSNLDLIKGIYKSSFNYTSANSCSDIFGK